MSNLCFTDSVVSQNRKRCPVPNKGPILNKHPPLFYQNYKKHTALNWIIAVEILNSYEWPKQNYSLHYQYNVKQESDENLKKVYLLWDH